MFTKCAVAVGMQDGGRQARAGALCHPELLEAVKLTNAVRNMVDFLLVVVDRKSVGNT